MILSVYRDMIDTMKEKKRRRNSSLYFQKKQLNHPGNYYSKHSFDYYQCIFIHIPKTAGIAISKILFGHYTDHATIDWYLENYHSDTINKYFKFAFVRNPWDRLYSAYSFLRQGGMYPIDRKFYQNNLSHLRSFREFVMEWLNDETMLSINHFIPQYKFITVKNDPNKICIDFTGRFENIQQDFKKVATQLNLHEKELVKMNISNNNKRYTEVYDDYMIDRIASLYQKDIQLFNYSFA